MFKDEIHAVTTSAAAKFALLKKNLLGCPVSSALASSFIGFLAFTAGGLLSASASPKIVMAVGIAKKRSDFGMRCFFGRSVGSATLSALLHSFSTEQGSTAVQSVNLSPLPLSQKRRFRH